MEQIVIWGVAGDATMMADTLRLQGNYPIAVFLDNVDPQLHHTVFEGAEILGTKKGSLGVWHLCVQ
jgi:hypothetical protein